MVAALGIALGGYGVYLMMPQEKTALFSMPQGPWVRIAQIVIPVEVARSSTEVQKGLSGRETLPENAGMLFVFERPARYRFWMPDMHFPLDIIWINKGHVAGIEKNIPPLADKKQPIFYTPQEPVRFVLETNAGFAKKNNIQVGDPVMLNYTEEE